MKTMVKARIPLCAREIRKRLTHLQGEELACPAEDCEQVDERVDEPVNELVDEAVDEGGVEQVALQEEEQPEQDLHAAEIMLRRKCHALEMFAAARNVQLFVVPAVI